MPPFETDLRKSSNPELSLLATAGHCQLGHKPHEPKSGLLGSAPVIGPLLPSANSATSRMAEMEATMTWKALPGGRQHETYPNSSLPEAVLHAQRGGKVLPELDGAA